MDYLIGFFDGTTALDLFGLAGAALYLGGYAAVQIGLIRGQGYIYPSIMMSSSVFVLIGLSGDFNLASALMQVFVVLISMVGIMRLYYLSRAVRFSREEREFHQTALSTLPKHLMRRLLDSGNWVEGEPGVVLTVEGEPIHELYFLTRGEVIVEVGGEVVAACPAPCFIGEISCLEGNPASATAVLADHSRYFCIGAKRLRQLSRRDPDVERGLRASFHAEMGRKLAASTRLQRDALAGVEQIRRKA